MMEKKSLSTGKKLCIILLFAVSIAAFGICIAFSFISIYALVSILPTGAVTLALLIILLRDYNRNKKRKTFIWYVDKILVTFVPVLIIAAIVLISFADSGERKLPYVGAAILFPGLGILSTPNIIMYVLKDMKDWKDILYKYGNLHKSSCDKNFYRLENPVPFQRKLYFSVIKNQLLNVGVVVGILIPIAIIALSVIMDDGSEKDLKGDVPRSVVHVKVERATDVLGIILILIIVIGLPILAYYLTNAICKLRVVRRYEYIAYHVIVSRVDGSAIKINYDGRYYKYDYCTCVGIRPKKVHNTRAVLVFIPDDVFLFPDKEADE